MSAITAQGHQFTLNLKNASWGTIEYFIAAILQLVAIPVVVKGIGVEMFGVLVIANTFLGLSGIFSGGLAQSTLKYVAKYRALNQNEHLSRIVQSTLAVYIIVSTLVGLTLYCASRVIIVHLFPVNPANLEVAVTTIRITSLGLVFYFANMSFDAAIRGFERFDLAVSIRSIANVCTQAGRIALVLCGFGVISLVWLTVAIIALEAVSKARIIRRKLLRGFQPIPRFSLSSLKEIWSFSFFTWISTIALLVRNNGEPLIVGTLLGADYVTYYSIAKGLIDQVLSLVGKTFGFVFPATSKLVEQGQTDIICREYNRLSVLALGIGVVIISPIAYLSFPLLTVWVGENIAAHTGLFLKILCIAFAFSPLGVINGNYLMAMGKVGIMSMLNVLATVITLPAIILGIRHWQFIGAAFAQCLSIIFVFVNRSIIEKSISGSFNVMRFVRLTAAIIIPVLLSAILPYRSMFDSPLIDLLLWGIFISCFSGSFFVLLIGNKRIIMGISTRLRPIPRQP